LGNRSSATHPCGSSSTSARLSPLLGRSSAVTPCFLQLQSNARNTAPSGLTHVPPPPRRNADSHRVLITPPQASIGGGVTGARRHLKNPNPNSSWGPAATDQRRGSALTVVSHRPLGRRAPLPISPPPRPSCFGLNSKTEEEGFVGRTKHATGARGSALTRPVVS
jgi:hypothetical protein